MSASGDGRHPWWAAKLGRWSARLALLAGLGSAATATARTHAGPFGLAWGRSPPEAISQLAGKATFVSELPATDDPYHTVDQHYRGDFGKLPTVDIFLRFSEGHFFYLAVSLVAMDGNPPIPASKVWQDVVDKMTAAYGGADRELKAPHLGPKAANFQGLASNANEARALPLMAQVHAADDPLAPFRLQDLQIRTQLWEPFARWQFANGVMVQAFLQPEPRPNALPLLRPMWIFVKEDLYKRWKERVRIVKIIEPRDY